MYKALYITGFILLLAVAVITRVRYFGVIGQFAGDEGIQLLISDHIVKYGDFRLDGEISALGTSGSYILHNSPIGYYVYTLSYILGGRTPEGYSVVYMVMNIIQALLLFGSGCLLFGTSGGIMVLLVALFSHRSITFSIWPSQPVNAVFFESIALYVFALYIRNRNQQWLWISALISLFATQLYPPMYILIFPKIVLFLYFVRRISFTWQRIAYVVISVYLIYVPLLLQEIFTQWKDLRVLIEFISHSGGNIMPSELLVRLIANFRVVFSELFPFPWLFYGLLFAVVVGIGIVKRNFTQTMKRVLIVGLPVFYALFTIAFYPLSKYVVPQRAYLEILLPFVCLLCGALMSGIPKKIMYLGVVMFIVVPLVRPVRIPNKSPWYLSDVRSITTTIVEDIHKHKTQPREVLLFTIGSKDSWSWDSSIYWYMLEQQLGKRLVRIDSYSGKAVMPDITFVQRAYLICHQIPEYNTDKHCLQVFIEDRLPNTFDTKFIVERVQKFSTSSLYILRNTGEIIE